MTNDLLQPNDAGLLLLMGILSWFFRRQIARYDKHLDECNKIPKELIIEKLDGLEAAFGKMADSQIVQGTQLATLLGRQLERDRVR